MGWTVDFSELLVSGGHVISEFAPWLALVLGMLLLPALAALFWQWRHGRTSGGTSPDPAAGALRVPGRVAVGAGAVGMAASGSTAMTGRGKRSKGGSIGGPEPTGPVAAAKPDYSDQWRQWHNDPYQTGGRAPRLAEVVPLHGPDRQRRAA